MIRRDIGVSASLARRFDIAEVRAAIEAASDTTKIFIGVDSERFKRCGIYYADYISAVVLHIDGCKGGQIFADVTTEKDYDNKMSRPFTRMMTEVHKAAELYLQLEDVLIGKDFEIHLDINPDDQHGSSCALQQAIGYIRGTCNVTPFVKPESWAASHVADRARELGLTKPA